MDELLKPSQVRKDRKPLPTYLPREVGGRFRVLSLLGSGACGDVVEAFDLQSRGVVALKILRADRVSEKVVKRFFREATAMGRVKHPGVVRVIDSGTGQAGIHYIAMELVKGQNLRDLMRARGGRLSAWEVARIAAEVCEVLQVAHSLGVIHRDLKPGNLIIPEEWGQSGETLKVVDFGVAKVYEDPDGEPMTNLTQTGESLGTPHYMAPEQVAGRAIDGRADLYGLGCIMYHAVSGYRPIDGPNQFAVLMGHLERRPVPLQQLVGNDYCPAYLSDFIDRLLNKDVEQRPINAAAAEAEVRQFIDLLPRKPAPMVSPPPSADALETFQSMGKALGGLQPAPRRDGPRTAADLPGSSGSHPARQTPELDASARYGTDTPPEIPSRKSSPNAAPTGIDPHSAPTGQQPVHQPDAVQQASLKHLGPMPTAGNMPAATEPGSGGLSGGAKVGIAAVVLLILFGAGGAFGLYAYNTRPAWLGLTPAADELTEVEADPDPEADPSGAKPAPGADEADPSGDKADPGGAPAGSADTLKVELETTPSGAVIYKNARIVGRTPLVVELDPDDAAPDVYLMARGGFQAESVVLDPSRLEGEGPFSISRDLQRLGGGRSTVEIHTDPPGAQVSLGRRFLGIAPVSVTQPLRKQTIKLRIEADGHEPRSVLVGLRREDQIVTVDLEGGADPLPRVVDSK